MIYLRLHFIASEALRHNGFVSVQAETLIELVKVAKLQSLSL